MPPPESTGSTRNKGRSKPQPGSTSHSFYQAQTTRPVVVVATIVFLTLEAWLMVYSMIKLWPSPASQPSAVEQPAGDELAAPSTSEAPEEGSQSALNRVEILFWDFEISDEGRLFVLVLLAGAFGGAVVAVRDLALGMKDANLPPRAIGWYIMRPLIASGLGLGFYLVIRGGFFSPQADVEQTSPFSFVGLATLVGFFSDQAVKKLAEIADAAFSPRDST